MADPDNQTQGTSLQSKEVELADIDAPYKVYPGNLSPKDNKMYCFVFFYLTRIHPYNI